MNDAGARPPAGSAGQVTDAILLSLTEIAVLTVVLPALVTRKLYGMTWPTLAKVVAVVDLAIDNAFVCTAVTVAVAVGEVAVPSLADATFVIEPASTLAWVVVCVAEHVRVAFGASPPAGMAGHETEAILSSVTVIVADAGMVTLPVLRTT